MSAQPRAFRFGTTAFARDRAEWLDSVRHVEDLGFSTVVIPDHFGAQMAPLPALVAAADATTRLRLGTLVFDNDFRHPAMLAKEVATADLLTDGRFEVGVGAG
jgi:alkanesulfonate monooxygenase SsuD/methylene tetrahydromethanopterin reductase-like flavin-dependent oxidoreductase (luciferase family)